ncbi:histidine kinase [Haloterrigena sp. H1]|uniref:sensor domain-containing protein n=1 Tax=Haloterrigena sp. H1 TaxID=2552943 RepID=UPI00110E6BEF|nr:sensor domain-containing protein [Haloterrigena sp. H1]TMT85244.1 histidine kinase [Haloterrigena sp. H1]
MSMPSHRSVGTAFDRARAAIQRFVGVATRRQTYRNIAYLLLSFPLGIGYFTVLVTGFAIPFGLLFAVVDISRTEPGALLIAGIPIALVMVCLGIPVAFCTLFASIELSALERRLADRLLGTDVPTADSADSVRKRAKRVVVDRGTWKGVAYLFSKFVIGTASFIVLVLGVTFTYTLVAAPLHYRNRTVGIHIGDPIEFVPELTYQHDGWIIDVAPVTLSIADGELISLYVDSLPTALAVSTLGVLVGLVVLHLFNAAAWLLAQYTDLLLRNTQPSIFSEPPEL